MENTYQIPKKGCSTKQERELFWRRIIDDQKSSGMPIYKFCQQHQIPFSAFKNKKYRLRIKEMQKVGSKDKGSAIDVMSNFVPVQIVNELADNLPIEKNIQDTRIKILFKNGHAIEFVSAVEAGVLSAIIEQVSQLLC